MLCHECSCLYFSLAAPVINTQHYAEVVTAGDSLNVSCKASGYPIPTIYFVKDQGLIKTGNHNVQDNNTFTVMSSLVIDSVMPNDSGEYLCVASNPYKSEVSKSILDVIVYCKNIKRCKD